MATGLIIRDGSGNITFSSEEAFGGVYACTVAVAGDYSATVYFDGTGGYPNLAGKTIRVLETGPGAHNWTAVQASTPYVIVSKRTIAHYFSYLPPATTTLRVFAV